MASRVTKRNVALCSRLILAKPRIEKKRFCSQSTNQETYGKKIFAVPAGLGLTVIAFLQFKRLRDDQYEIESNQGKAHPNIWLYWFKYLPTRALSRVWGSLAETELPTWMRRPVFMLWTKVYDCNLDEMKHPLESYKSLADFFARSLKNDARPMSSSPCVSPVDAKVMHFGVVDRNVIQAIETETTNGYVLEQVKGIRYSLKQFLGNIPWLYDELNGPNLPKDRQLHYAILYLAPGDYHRIHSSADWSVLQRMHHPGELLPVAPWAMMTFPSLLATNERVVLAGTWKFGFFAMVAVGAYNVGSIVIKIDKDMPQTNQKFDLEAVSSTKIFRPQVDLSRGLEIAGFRMGSTVVILWEAPKGCFTFSIREGDKVRVGQALGHFKE